MDEQFDFILKRNISEILKSLSEKKIEEVAKALIEDVGLEEFDDLRLITDEDLKGLLKPLQRRKLLQAWTPEAKQVEIKEVDPSPEPGTSRNTILSQSTWPQNFKLPWQNMPRSLITSLEKGERPRPKLRREMLRIVVDEIRKITTLPGRKAIAMIAKKMTDDFPASLIDQHDGEIILDGTSSLVKQMRNRLENLNRGNLGPKKNDQNIGAACYPLKEVVNKDKNKYGFLNWEPSLPIDESDLSQEEKRQLLITEYLKGPQNMSEDLVLKLILETFPTQRQEINNSVNILSIIDRWPCLFIKNGMLKHFELLMGINLEERFLVGIQQKGTRILNCLETLPRGSNKALLETALKQTYPDVPSSLIGVIMGYFGDKSDSLFHLANVTTSTNDVLNVLNLPTTPCLFACGDNIYTSNHYMLLIDGGVASENISSFVEGFLMLFASFYIFNIKYPKAVDGTLEFLQRCFFSVNPTRGSKSSKVNNKSAIQPRVLTLINTIADFEWL